MRFYTVQKLGPKRSLTPEGFLLCEEVPVARTGEMIYGPGEVPVEPGPDGLIRISRTPEEVFRDETLASCVGKPVTLDHPDDFVGPTNFAALGKGAMLNVRRGSGIEDDLMIADLLVTDAEAIKAIQDDGIEEVSLGYEADYEQVSPGRGVQRNIVVNHVALVERGRCGPRCAIGDKEPEEMKTKDSKPKGKRSFADRLRAAFMAKDAESAEELAKEAEAMDEESEEEREEREAKEKDGKTGDALSQILKTVKALDARMAKIEARDAKAKDQDKPDEEDEDDSEDETEDEILNAETAAKLNQADVDLYTGDAAASIPSRAEILAPGIKLPTLDAKMSTKDRAAALCKCQRKALDLAYKTDAGRALIGNFLGGLTADFEKMPAALVNAAFMGASEMMKAKNNAAGAKPAVTTKDFGSVTAVATINQRAREFWANRK
uniref:Putative bacteriophage protein n=1 Tax=Ralstonia pickettii (strain 12D) TaxID=428406 RepID=C6BBT1_RALP1